MYLPEHAQGLCASLSLSPLFFLFLLSLSLYYLSICLSLCLSLFSLFLSLSHATCTYLSMRKASRCLPFSLSLCPSLSLSLSLSFCLSLFLSLSFFLSLSCCMYLPKHAQGLGGRVGTKLEGLEITPESPFSPLGPLYRKYDKLKPLHTTIALFLFLQ